MIVPTSLSSQCKCRSGLVNVRYREDRELSIFAQKFLLARGRGKGKGFCGCLWTADVSGACPPGAFADSLRFTTSAELRSVLFAAETITHAGDSEDKARAGRIRLDFAAQLANIDVQVMGIRTIAGPPDLGQEHLPRHDFAIIFNQRLEQIILGRRQLDLRSMYRHQALGKIYLERTGEKDRLGAGLDLCAMAQRDPDTRQHLIHAKGFGYIIICP